MKLPVSLHLIGHVGDGLVRPECVLTTQSGDLFASNFDGGVTRIRCDGTQSHIFGRRDGPPVLTNGFAILPSGDFLLADLGDQGGVWRMDPNGALTPFVESVAGQRLPPANFVSIDSDMRVWISVSTRREPRSLAYRSDIADGFLILTDTLGRSPRIVADGLGYSNEVHVHPLEDWLYVNETFGQRLSRFPLLAGELGKRETVAEFTGADFPDGLWFDEDGGILVTCIVSNRVYRVLPDGKKQIVIGESCSSHRHSAASAFANNALGREHLDTIPARSLKNVSSIAFGGARLDTAYLGCLLGENIVRFQSPIIGLRPPHWDWT